MLAVIGDWHTTNEDILQNGSSVIDEDDYHHTTYDMINDVSSSYGQCKTARV